MTGGIGKSNDEPIALLHAETPFRLFSLPLLAAEDSQVMDLPLVTKYKLVGAVEEVDEKQTENIRCP